MMAHKMKRASRSRTAVSFITSDNASPGDVASHTFSSVSLGVADPDRYIVVAVATYDNDLTSGGLASVTVAGVSATKLVERTNAALQVSLWRAAVPTGTSGDIVCTSNDTETNWGIGVFRLIHEDGATHDTAGATSTTVSIDGVTNGAVIGASLVNNGAGSSSWTGATGQYEDDIRSGEYHSGAMNNDPPSGAFNLINDQATIIVGASWE